MPSPYEYFESADWPHPAVIEAVGIRNHQLANEAAEAAKTSLLTLLGDLSDQISPAYVDHLANVLRDRRYQQFLDWRQTGLANDGKSSGYGITVALTAEAFAQMVDGPLQNSRHAVATLEDGHFLLRFPEGAFDVYDDEVMRVYASIDPTSSPEPLSRVLNTAEVLLVAADEGELWVNPACATEVATAEPMPVLPSSMPNGS